ncbi:wax ester/triacylglycerol synthase family O-acyltransferase [Euzebya sp.]|uniref:wax ester/triacylglycerol synthase family O-acyltransferase n=1 Tax=Euzebya sp. TaxID=1971409 RepID=UPI003518F516
MTARTAPDRLNPLDVWFLHVEDTAGLMHIGSVLILEGPAPPFEELARTYAARLARLPRYTQVVREVPLGLHRPVWVDDPSFCLAYHLRRTALPPPGGTAELDALVGRVMGQRLDRRRPLWETWVVEGLEDRRWALVSKVHHCMVDGVAGTDLTMAIMDPAPATADAATTTSETARQVPDPGRLALVRQAVGDRLAGAAGSVRAAGRAVRHPRDAGRAAATVGRGLRTITALGRPVPPSSLSGPLTSHRRWDTAWTDLDTVKAIGQAVGGTVNDVLLTAVTRGFRDLLVHRGEPDAVVRSLIPVSTRATGARGHLDNRVAAVFATLPTQVGDPLDCLRAVQAEMDALKASGEVDASAAIVQASGAVPSVVLGPIMHATSALVDRFGQRNVTTVVTNVPGPPHALHLLGRRALAWYPYVPVAEGVRLGVAVLSYDGQVFVGATGEFAHAEDLPVLTRGIEQAIADLRVATQHRRRPGDPAVTEPPITAPTA